jgi:hypothetical protein
MKRLTIEAIAEDPWNAVNLALPANATEYLLKIARAATLSCLKTQYAQMDDPDRAGDNVEHFCEQDWANTLNRLDELEQRLTHL